jgi:hypothetical protein
MQQYAIIKELQGLFEVPRMTLRYKSTRPEVAQNP